MFTMRGKHSEATIMTNECDEITQQQLMNFLSHPAFKGSKIVIMPDCHAGAGAVIGTTMKIGEYVCPNIVGVDIGCGLDAYNLGQQDDLDLPHFDKFVHDEIPTGGSVRQQAASWPDLVEGGKNLLRDVESLTKRVNQHPRIDLDLGRVMKSIGSLGGGNHFIELDRDDNGDTWLVLHSGSRNFGYRVAFYHQQKAKEYMLEKYEGASAYKNLEYLPVNGGGNSYIQDMRVAQMYAEVNRRIIAQIILEGYFGEPICDVEDAGHVVRSVHNYISFHDWILRKGAITAFEGEKCIIPLNMLEGCLLCTGKGAEDWNNSAPHGAGRLMSRSEARRSLSLEEFEQIMKDAGIYSSCIGKSTLDEAPGAYKDPDFIKDSIGDTVTIDCHMKPIYIYKDTTGGRDRKTGKKDHN